MVCSINSTTARASARSITITGSASAGRTRRAMARSGATSKGRRGRDHPNVASGIIVCEVSGLLMYVSVGRYSCA